ncbi:MAG: leucyl aminopeptidase family protein [Alphaproteobacteria bacterium]|nr:MAG: leucyl aminopeptidase family protein [Alphaproteobacteria bacterium]TAF76971.1 MAG: leucyl aminopeptidase family protein [Alphaproteobacteria bacterium]
MSIPIYLLERNDWHTHVEAIGGAPLLQWASMCGLGEKHRSSTLIYPDAEGNIALVILLCDTPLNLWSCANLATDLPQGTYRLVCKYLSEIIEEDVKCELALGWKLQQYHFGRYKARTYALPELEMSDCIKQHITPFVQAITTARDLINTPPADMGPEELADAAHTIAKTYHAKYHCIEGKKIASDYPAIHAVGKGSPRAPRLIELRWGQKTAPLVTLIGKGVCFDTGGLDIKSASGMLLMKKDMGGAAVVLGLAKLIMAHGMPIQLRVLIPAVENSVDGESFRPSDIIRMRKGISIEIGNTDAEGRLILADAITDACEEHPELIIDCATLTGAARVALGTDIPALFTNNDTIAQELMRIGKEHHDMVWHLPLYEGYADQISSPIADGNNVSTSAFGGAITAALFLKQFVTPTIDWVHLDMMAWNVKARAGRPLGGEAMGLRTLFYWLQQRYPHRPIA